jgi:hypothetical protein
MKPMMYDDSYTAARITILEAEEAKRRFGFVQAATLAVQYPSIASAFIERLLESCRLTGFPVETAIRRYLDKDGTAQGEVHKDQWETLRVCHQDLVRRQYQTR